VNAYSCSCDAGYDGDHCENNINECAGVNCNNGNCVDQVNAYSCSCDAGYDGDHCENNINECAGVNCNNGNCVDQVNAYSCSCDPGYSGNHCENAPEAASCLDWKNFGYNDDGVYWITLPTVGAAQVYCLMDSAADGGGWTLAMKAANSGNTFGYHSGYWDNVNTLNVGSVNRNSEDAKFDVFNYMNAGDIMATFPDKHQYIGYGFRYNGFTTNFWPGYKTSAQNFFKNAGQRQIAYGSAVWSWSGWNANVWSSQAGSQWCGFNYQTFNQFEVRFGFAWNNEVNDWGSNDVTGGLGLDNSGRQGVQPYSAGDHIGCCQHNNGVNGRLKMELWVR
jgi:hypothetical protein